MNYFVDESGTYLGAWDQGGPAGGIKVPEAPQDARQPWLFPGWGEVPISAEDIASRRYQAEISGIVISGMSINTDDRSKLLINGAALEATIDPAYTMQWKTQAGFVELNAAQVVAVARAVRAHVQACFDREAELLEALAAGTLTALMLEQGWS